MRFLAAVLLWLIATVASAAAIPACWTQRNVIDVDGYTALAQQAAGDPTLQAAVAAELTRRVGSLIARSGNDIDTALVREVADAYTVSPAFPPQFAQANRIAHDWMFRDAASEGQDGRWVMDLAPLLRDPAFAQLLTDNHVRVPDSIRVELSPPDGLRPGVLAPLARWGLWVSLGTAVLAGGCVLGTLVAARRRGRAMTSLGVSALLVGAAGYAGIEVGRRRLDDALSAGADDLRRIADTMLDFGEASLHHWLLLTLAAGGVLVVLGVVAAMLGGLRQRGGSAPSQPAVTAR